MIRGAKANPYDCDQCGQEGGNAQERESKRHDQAPEDSPDHPTKIRRNHGGLEV